MHRNQQGKLIEINKMHFKNDHLCYAKIYALKHEQLLALHIVANAPKQCALKLQSTTLLKTC